MSLKCLEKPQVENEDEKPFYFSVSSVVKYTGIAAKIKSYKKIPVYRNIPSVWFAYIIPIITMYGFVGS